MVFGWRMLYSKRNGWTMDLRNVTTRRGMGRMLLSGGGLAAMAGCAAWLRLRDASTHQDLLRGGKLLGVLPFEDEGKWPLDTLLGDELDGRRLTDLSHVDRDPVTPTGEFYIRTRASHLLDTSRPWSVSWAVSLAPCESQWTSW
jgi:hypothetical protein